MTKYELLKLCKSVCISLLDNGINLEDAKFLEMYDDYLAMRKEGHKYDYVIYYLSQKYNKSESSVWRTIKRMSAEVAKIESN